MIAWILSTALASPTTQVPVLPDAGWEKPPMLRHDVPRPLPLDEPSFHGIVDVGGLVIVRPQGLGLQTGFTTGAFTQAVEASLEGRDGYDFVTVMHSDQLPTQFSGAAAFHLTYNNTDEFGTGKYHTSTPTVAAKAALWMSYPSYWDAWGEGIDVWVFGQELGHQWLAFADFDDGNGTSDALLGRAGSHWSWFMDTPNSPMEGNAWIDHGDGTFTTDLTAPFSFSDLDLYMMGLIEQDAVGPMFYIEPSEPIERVPGSSPEFLWSEEPVTVAGTRVDVTVDEVVAAHGDRLPSAGVAQRDFTILPVLVVGPEEMLTQDLIDQTRARYDAWELGWTELTLGLSTVTLDIVDEPRTLPASNEALVPRGAW